MIITELSLLLQSYLEKFIKLAAYSEKRSEKRANFHEKVVTLTLFEVEDRLHLGKTQIKFGFSLDLHYLCIVILKRVTRKGSLSRD